MSYQYYIQKYKQNQLPQVKFWWLHKAIQALNKEFGSQQNEELQELENQLHNLVGTSMSPKVYELVMVPKSVKILQDPCLDDGTLDFSKFTISKLTEGVTKQDEDSLYFTAARYIQGAAISIHNTLISLSVNEFLDKFQDKFILLSTPNVSLSSNHNSV